MIRIILVSSFILFCSVNLAATTDIKPRYKFKFMTDQWLTMEDGTKLSVSYWQPIAKNINEKFPVVVEILPYRKDDNGYIGAYNNFAYLARRGIAGARIDVRGTGSSTGITPNREYSDEELNDIPIILNKISKLSWSNGNLGMMGISWGAFNALMTAMRNPPELKALFIAHGSHDLYANDIHNIDGALHIDIFTIEIDIDNIIPRSPNYKIDKNYFSQRFNQKPWIFTYLHHQRDSEFWQHRRSLKTDYASLKIPTFIFASLLDGYRDYAINILNNAKAPIKLNIGPQNHSWPDGSPGPVYNWHQLAAQWWKKTLVDKSHISENPKITIFRRDYVAPDVNLENTHGLYTEEKFPFSTQNITFFLTPNRLAKNTTQSSIDKLVYKASGGDGILNWWGETTPDMQFADKDALIYDSNILQSELNLLGNAEINLRVAANAPLADWFVRLEDVSPSGKVSFVTGALANGTQRYSRTHPKALPLNTFFTLNFPLHFSTWKFKPHHKIRLAISNSQFPMTWPTPYKMTTQLEVGSGISRLILPIANTFGKKVTLTPLEKNENPNDATTLSSNFLTPFKISRDQHGGVIATAKESYQSKIRGTLYKTRYKVEYQVNDKHPEIAIFKGEGEDTVKVANTNRTIKVKALTNIRSDQKYFYVSVARYIYQNGKLLRIKQWQEKIVRDYQ